MQDHNYSTQDNIGLLIKPKYADDISWRAANCIQTIEVEKAKTTPKLKARGLMVNESKNEAYDISPISNDKWKTCKIPRSLLDT